MKRFMLATLLLSLLAMPLGLVSAMAAPHEEHALNLNLNTQEHAVPSETILVGEAFGYKNSAWMRLGAQIDHRMAPDIAVDKMAGAGQAMARGMGNVAAPQPEPTFFAANLETGETISLPYGIPVVPLSTDLKLTPRDLNGPSGGSTRPMRAV